MLWFLRRSLPRLPDKFRFGVGNSDHQCEAFDERFPDIWDVWGNLRGLQPRDRATDFAVRFPEDIDLARKLGCSAFRFSTSWARIEPEPGKFNQESLQHYRRVADTIRAAGMQPIVTLHHFVWPLHIEKRGGMVADDFPKLFAEYARTVAEALGKVEDWVTFNEPNLLCFGFLRPWWQRDFVFPPGLPPDAGMGDQLRMVARLIANLFRAHARAREAIHTVNPQARVGANPSLLGLPAWLQRLVDLSATWTGSHERFLRWGSWCNSRGLERGKVDAVISSVTITSDRRRKVDFSSVYMIAKQRLLVRADSGVLSAAELAGKRVAIVAHSTAEQTAKNVIPGANVTMWRSHAQAKHALDTGLVDAVLADDVLMDRWKSDSTAYHLSQGELSIEPYGIAVPRGQAGLLDAIDGALRYLMSTGYWQKTVARHFPDSPDFAPPCLASRRTLRGTDAEIDIAALRKRLPPHILKRGCLRIAVSAGVPKLGWRDPQTGEWSGLEVDLARGIGEVLLGDGKRIELQQVETVQRISILQTWASLVQRLLEPVVILSTVLCTNWWHLGQAGRLPTFLCPPECVGTQDYVGFDYYWGLRSLRLDRIVDLVSALTRGDFLRAPVWPGALYSMLRYHARLHPNLPIYIIESGSIGVADKIDRAKYYEEHMKQVQRAFSKGTNVTTFLVWSITTNREWNSKFGPGSDFGLYSIDLDSDPGLVRHPTMSVDTYRRIIAERGVAK